MPQIVGSVQLTFTGGVAAPQFYREQSQAILTDGARVYFVDYSGEPGPGLAYVSKAGGEVVRIPSPVERSLLLGLSPDGGKLLVGDATIPGTDDALWVVPTSGGAPRRLGDVIAHAATWSPDGQSLVYARGEELYLSSSDGGQPRSLATTPGRAHWIRWSPDGRHLRFTLIGTNSHRRSIWEVSADGTDLHLLPLQWDERPQECCGEWSRDGRYFVFSAIHEQRADLWMVDETGNPFRGRSWRPRRLTSDALESVAAVSSIDGKELYTVKARSTSQMLQYDPRARLVAASPFRGAQFLRFSRDRRWLAYGDLQVQRARTALRRSRVDGSRALQLTAPPMEVFGAPCWSPDGRQIAFTGRLPGKPFKAYVVSSDGGAPEQALPGERDEVDLDGRRTAGR
jgi:dipeptidyl aminopeptidase/acylaminoacyl peptidase